MKSPASSSVVLCLCLLVAGRASVDAQPVEAAAPAAGKFAVEVTLTGLVALTPDGTGVVYGTPMDTSDVERVIALFPLAGSEQALHDLPVPDPLEFLARKGRPHPAHFLFLRIPSKTVGGECGQVYVPLPAPGEGDWYTVKFDNLKPGTEPAHYEGFKNVAPLVGGDGTQFVALDDEALSKNKGITARMEFGKGWVLKPAKTEPGPMVRMSCWKAWFVSSCSDPKPVVGTIGDRALTVSATIADQTGPLAIQVLNKDGKKIVHLPLQAPEPGEPLRVAVGHSQLSEMFGGHFQREHHHFNLYHLLAKAIDRPYYYPFRNASRVDAETGRGHTSSHDEASRETSTCYGIRIEPYCTPLAQLVRKKP